MHKRVLVEILLTKKDKFAHHKDVDAVELQNNAHVYPGVYQALDDMGLIPFVTFNQPYSEELVL